MPESSDIRSSVSSSKGHPKKRSITFSVNRLVTVAIVVVLCGISFALGMWYQKSHTSAVASTSTSGSSGQTGASGSTGFAQRSRNGAFGQVTTISSTSITIQNSRTGSSTTYSIGSSTTITDSGQTVTTSDIQVGDTVAIRVASAGSTQATSIDVNPSFGGGFGGGGGASGSSFSGGQSSTDSLPAAPTDSN
jgi:FlaG/FlaF family flagellin (archaellin)